ncbi:MAG: patatin-like phospholipase family protein [Muribaculaceae bacterium]|nr:patatin-like phospholipase family protein [Muribaculaceae bacterium]
MIWNIEGILEKVGLVSNSVGYAFSGGGARGFSHIGVLKAFEEFDIHPDVMAGVSAGSIAAVLYGAGLSPDDMLKCFKSVGKLNEFVSWKVPGNSVLKIDRFGRLLESWLPFRYLEDLKIPTIVCATDFGYSKSIGWGKGEIVPRVLASCSIPIAFEPVEINGGIYVDGGVLRNLPAWAVRKYCKTLYGINCSPLNIVWKGSSKHNLLEIALRSYHMMSKSNMITDAKMCDVLINLRGAHAIGTFDISKLDRSVSLGYETACRVLERTLKTQGKTRNG